MTYDEWMKKIYNPEIDTRIIETEKNVWIKIPQMEPFELTRTQYDSLRRTIG